MLFEANTKRYLLAGDAFPFHYKYARSLDKGDYLIKLHVRHEKMEMVEKLKDITLNLRHNLPSSLSQDIYTSYAGLLKGTGKKNGAERIPKGTDTSFFLYPIADDKLPKNIANGYYLVGEMSFFKDSAVSKVVCLFYSLK
jgi:tripeptidyl-peptidase-2